MHIKLFFITTYFPLSITGVTLWQTLIAVTASLKIFSFFLENFLFYYFVFYIISLIGELYFKQFSFTID